jgi:ABC-type sugar transport system permease subunit
MGQEILAVKSKRNKSITKQKWKNYLFVASIVTWPLLIFVVFWLGGNLTRITLAFQKYNTETFEFETLPLTNFFDNFIRFFQRYMGEDGMLIMFGRSLLFYAIGILMIVPHVFVSYFLYKKVRGSQFYTVILFLPSIISGVVWVIVYKNIIELALPAMLEPLGIKLPGSLLKMSDTVFPALVGYHIWMTFAGGMVLYTGAFSKISNELVEAGKVDGLGTWKEFWYLSFPLIFSTVAIHIFTGVVGIFTSSPSTFTFFSTGAPFETYTFGYYFMSLAYSGKTTPIEYPFAAACSIIFTAIAAPLSFLLKYLTERYDPGKED